MYKRQAGSVHETAMGVKNSGPGRKSFLIRWHLCACTQMRERETGQSGRESLTSPTSVMQIMGKHSFLRWLCVSNRL